ncbi:hypothetical protein QL288_22915 [Citrobacter youngae]|nr:hypothetical protein [Citrobacter youngae]
MTTLNKHTELRKELSNPSIGSNHQLRKLALSLLDELEASQKSNEFLKEQLAQLANFNPDWDKLEAATDSLREHMAKLSAAEKRIAELGGQKRLIGWRAADYTDETSDPALAKNWAVAVGVLPIFEGDVNTKLSAAGIGVKGE